MRSKDTVDAEIKSRGQHYFATLLWMFLGFVFVSLFSQWFTNNSRDAVLTQYIDHVIQNAANEHHSAKEVRALILIKAEIFYCRFRETEFRSMVMDRRSER